MEPHVTEKPKKKKKKNFLRHIKQEGKRGYYGRGETLSQEQYNYYITIFEHLKHLEGEERELLVRNFLIGIVQEEDLKKLASNQIVSRILDDTLQYGEVPQVLALTKTFSEDVRTTCLDPYASHVLQTLMAVALKFTQKHAVQKDTTGENEVDIEEKKIPLPVPLEQRKEFSTFLNKIGRFVYNNLDEFILDSYGSHVFRTVLETCSGVQLKDSIRSSQKSQSKHTPCHDIGQILRIPPKLQRLLGDIAQRLLQLPELPSIITSDCGSPALQSALLVLKGTDHKDCSALVDHILENGLANILPMHCDSVATDLPMVFHSNGAVYLLEVIMSCATIQQLSGIFSQYFEGHMLSLVKHQDGNFAVQKLLLSWQDKETFHEVFQQVLEVLPVALEVKHTGVIFALSQACRKLQKNQGQCWKAIMELLRCYKPLERQNAGALCLMRFLNYDEYQKKHSGGELPSASLHGSLILQDFLHFNKTLKIVNSVLSMNFTDLKWMSCDPRGSHVVDAFCSSTFIKINNKEKLISSFRGTYVALACSKHGSRSLEAMWNVASIKLKTEICEELGNEEMKLKGNKHGAIIFNHFKVAMFNRTDKQDWQQLVDSAAKKKRKLDELISDVVIEGEIGESKKKKQKKKHLPVE